jgi:hypothetical protein
MCYAVLFFLSAFRIYVYVSMYSTQIHDVTLFLLSGLLLILIRAFAKFSIWPHIPYMTFFDETFLQDWVVGVSESWSVHDFLLYSIYNLAYTLYFLFLFSYIL